ncbi:MAG: hypothetical protein HOE90_06200 [Bacteriovoracaceae bacterium]|jgi:hypothetical protein|nr:hypothetical protein [Bacteriovoracaceae bacterium]
MIFKTSKFSQVILIVAIACCFLIHAFLNQHSTLPPIDISMQKSAININHEALKLFSMGQKRLIVAIMWIKTLIDSDLEHYKSRDLNSWMYLRFKSIVELDPLFLQAYQFGGQYLSIIKDDDLGAKDIYDRGLEQYSKNHKILVYGGLHYYFELDDPQGALKFWNPLIFLNKVPFTLKSLISRVKASNGRLEDAYSLILKLYKSTPEGSVFKKKFSENLYAIKSEIDLICLNSQTNSIHCNKNDFDGGAYLYNKTDGKYIANKKWKPFRIKTRAK